MLLFSAPAPELVDNEAETEPASEPDNSDLSPKNKLGISSGSALTLWVFGYGKSDGPSIWSKSYRYVLNNIMSIYILVLI